MKKEEASPLKDIIYRYGFKKTNLLPGVINKTAHQLCSKLDIHTAYYILYGSFEA